MTAIDIILPFFNGSKFFKEQLDSILNNDVENISLRFIIVNDASSSEETIFLKNLLPPNCIYIENDKNVGVIKSVERGLKTSTAPYIMLCDQDDVWLPKKIKNSLNRIVEIEGSGPALVYTDLVIVDSNLKTLHPSMHNFYKHNHQAVYPSILFHNIVTGCTIIMNRKLLEVALPIPQEITMHDHWIAICAVFTGKIALLDEATILYRQHGGNQIGAPSRFFWVRLSNLRVLFSRFSWRTEIKIKMASALAIRLQECHHLNESRFVKKVVDALTTKNFLFLIKNRVITGKLNRIIGQFILLIFNRYKA